MIGGVLCIFVYFVVNWGQFGQQVEDVIDWVQVFVLDVFVVVIEVVDDYGINGGVVQYQQYCFWILVYVDYLVIYGGQGEGYEGLVVLVYLFGNCMFVFMVVGEFGQCFFWIQNVVLYMVYQYYVDQYEGLLDVLEGELGDQGEVGLEMCGFIRQWEEYWDQDQQCIDSYYDLLQVLDECVVMVYLVFGMCEQSW